MTNIPHRLVIANRGEIACRIIKTAKKLGIETIAVYSDTDRNARHVRLADQALHIGPAVADQSYLNIERILDVARRIGADAIHPGYGFLSENAEFAEACAASKILFIGPPPNAIRAMGSKAEAKRLLESVAVPLTPGYHGEIQEDAALLFEAEKLGYPLLIKASAGGGGKGIRRVNRREEFLDALATCQREATASFRDPRVLLERYIVRPRHIEFQIFADTHGNILHLGERDCSIQRRHQKVLEEAPAPGMTPAQRQVMGETAVNAARRVGYIGAGTVEFIVEPDGAFYFMEMNTRLQVEHPVTELITGFDLVEWQLRVASGEPLPITQEQLRLHGHAIEARLYAEDPSQGFLPSAGTIRFCHLPSTSEGVRIDAGVESGDEISPYYDAMIAKLIVHGRDRREALTRLETTLRGTFLVGPRNNLDFLVKLIRTRSIQEADLDTHVIDREMSDLNAAALPLPESMWMAALAAKLLQEKAPVYETIKERNVDSILSPWAIRDGFRIAGRHQRLITFAWENERCEMRVEYLVTGWRVITARAISLNACRTEDAGLQVHIDNWVFHARAFVDDDVIHVQVGGRQAALRVIDLYATKSTTELPRGGLRSPMPGRVAALNVRVGDSVTRGTALLAIEAMKMEHVITAPADGVVEKIHVTVGTQVAEGVALVDFAVT